MLTQLTYIAALCGLGGCGLPSPQRGEVFDGGAARTDAHRAVGIVAGSEKLGVAGVVPESVVQA